MKKVVYKISGMHCKSCEILIEDKLREIGVDGRINVDNQREVVEIYTEKEPIDNDIKNSLRNMGYDLIGRIDDKDFKFDSFTFVTKNKQIYKDLFIAAIVFITLYMLFGVLKLDKLFVADLSGNSVSWTTAIMVGLTAGVSTCMALVGGLVMGISSKFSEKNPNLTGVQKFKPHLFFNIGRIIGFFLLGGVLGLIGSAFKISMSLTGFLTIGVGVFMLLLGLQLLGVFPFLSKFKITLPKSVARFFGVTDSNKEYSHKGAMILGALTFFLPCGFTQAMQLYSISSGGFFTGGLIMALFAIGTAPGLLGIGGLAAFVKGKFASIFFKIAGFVVISFSLINFSNGYNLTLVGDLSGYSKPSCSSGSNESSACSLDLDSNYKDSDFIVSDDSDTQIIKADFDVDNDISPTVFRVNVGKPVRFEINAKEEGAGCMSTIMISGVYNKPKFIEKGLNVLSFTPIKSGNYPIVCAMGVKRGTLIVQ